VLGEKNLGIYQRGTPKFALDRKFQAVCVWIAFAMLGTQANSLSLYSEIVLANAWRLFD